MRLDLSALVSDVDSGLADLRFSVSADSAQVQLEIEAGELVATPVIPNYWGELVVSLTVRDPTGLESSIPLPIAIQPRNNPPLITSAPDTVVATDSRFVYRLTATDADGDALTFSLREGPQGMACDQALHCAVWRTPSPGLHPVVFAVSDNEATSHQRFHIRVGTTSTLRFATRPATRARRGQLYTYQPEVDDEGGGLLVFSLAEGPRRMLIDAQTGMLTWIPADADTALVDVALQVTGGSQQQLQRFQIHLVEGNVAPVILSTPVAVGLDRLALHLLATAPPMPTATPWFTP